MKVTLVRHAQTEDDYQRKTLGRRNELLNDSGRRQVLRLRTKLKDRKYDVCYVSPLTRCMETALVSVGDRTEMIPDQRLIQREMGELDGRSIDEYNAYLFWDYDLNKNDFGVESIQNLFSRVSDFLDYIKKKYKKKDVIIVTHDEIYRALRYLLKNHKLKGKLLDGKIAECQTEDFEI